jgi:hypothetical protein
MLERCSSATPKTLYFCEGSLACNVAFGSFEHRHQCLFPPAHPGMHSRKPGGRAQICPPLRRMGVAGGCTPYRLRLRGDPPVISTGLYVCLIVLSAPPQAIT